MPPSPLSPRIAPADDVQPAVPTRVVIVDDHRLVADSVAMALERADDVTVVGIAATAAEGLALVREQQPDVLLLDQRLPDGLGTDLLPELIAASPSSRILLVTGSDTDDVLRAAMAGGSAGFVAKGQRASALLDAVRRAAAGEMVVSAEDMQRLLPAFLRGKPRLGHDLTAREKDVLRLLAKGRTTGAIAAELFIAPSTARNHIQSVIGKLGAHSKLEAVAIALRENIVVAE